MVVIRASATDRKYVDRRTVPTVAPRLGNPIFSALAALETESRETLRTFLQKYAEVEAPGNEVRTLGDKDIEDAIGVDHPKAAQNKFGGYIKELEVELNDFEKCATEKGFTSEEAQAIRKKMEAEVEWLVGKFTEALTEAREEAKAAKSLAEVDKAFNKLADYLFNLNYLETVHGPRMLKRKLQLEIERDPIASWGINERYVVPSHYRAFELYPISSASFNFRLDSGDPAEALKDAGINVVKFVREELFSGGVFYVNEMKPELLKEIGALRGIGIMMTGLSISILLLEADAKHIVEIRIQHADSELRRGLLEGIGKITRQCMAAYEEPRDNAL